MFTKRTLVVSAALVVASLGLVGCSSSGGSMGGMSEGDSPSASDTFNQADIQFTAMMIPHHEQAVDMSDMILAKTDIDPAVTELAQQIRDAQAPEIDQMSGWLDDWNVDMGSIGDTGMSGMDHSTNGMMSDDDMQALDDATGAEASRLYLEGMIEHHEGAIEMAETEISDGKDPEAIALAEEIATSQTAEIVAMEDLLANL